MTAVAIAVGGVFLVGLLVMVVVIRRMLYVAQPNEVLVLSGVRRTGANGRILTYRTIRSGRVIRMPLLNRIDRLDLTAMDIELTVEGLPARDFVPCTVQCLARVHIADREPELGNAIPRLMGLRREEIAELARELLAGTLRRVFVALRPEEADGDRQRLAGLVSEEIDGDFSRLGLVLSDIGFRSIEGSSSRAEPLPRLGALGATPRGGRPTT